MFKMFQKTLLLPFALLIAESPELSSPREYILPPNVPESSWYHTVDLLSFVQKSKTSPPAWMLRGIRKELAPFRQKKITQESISKTFQKVCPSENPSRYAVSRIRIIDNKVYRIGSPGQFDYERMFRTLGRLCDFPEVPNMPNIDFLLCQMEKIPLEDNRKDFWVTENFADQAPVMAFAKDPDTSYVLLVPDVFTLDQWHNVSKEILSLHQIYPWSTKEKKAFWRGRPTDFNRTLDPLEVVEDYKNKPRYTLCDFSFQCPDQIDAGFNAPGSAPDPLWNSIAHLVKPEASFREHLRYAYLPVLDGAAPSRLGVLWRLLSDSVCFKHLGALQWRLSHS